MGLPRASGLWEWGQDEGGPGPGPLVPREGEAAVGCRKRPQGLRARGGRQVFRARMLWAPLPPSPVGLTCRRPGLQNIP